MHVPACFFIHLAAPQVFPGTIANVPYALRQRAAVVSTRAAVPVDAQRVTRDVDVNNSGACAMWTSHSAAAVQYNAYLQAVPPEAAALASHATASPYQQQAELTQRCQVVDGCAKQCSHFWSRCVCKCAQYSNPGTLQSAAIINLKCQPGPPWQGVD
jgi:hypothetical protein